MKTKMATCHPDRLHLAKGLCSTCYEKTRKGKKIAWVEGPRGKRATCHPEKRNYSHGLCRECHREKFLDSNPDKKAAYYETHRRNWHGYHLKHNFGITVEQYESMLTAQKGVCAICGKPENGNRHLSVDHNHTTNKIRGLLCQKCNSIVGMSDENPNILVQTQAYLDKHKE